MDIRNGTPIATIESLENNTIVNEHDIVEFTGSGEDVDGVIVQYEWESSLDGFLSDYSSFATNTLSIGEHVISFRVMDDDDQWSSPEQITVTVNAYPVIHEVFWHMDSIYRNDVTFIHIDADDNEDNDNISIEIQYLVYGDELVWTDCACYQNNTNLYTFVPDESFDMGSYSFRVLAIDSNFAITYYYYNNSLFINNNHPVIDYIYYH